MKKIIIACFSLFLLTGCGTKQNLDLSKIEIEVQNLKEDKFSFDSIQSSVENEKTQYEDFEDFEDIEREFDLQYKDFNKILARKNYENGSEYIIIDPIKGQEEIIETKMVKYLEKETKIKTTFEKYKGLFIFVKDIDPNKTMEKIRSSKKLVFSQLIPIIKADLNTTMKIKESWLEESLVLTSKYAIKANSLIILKPNKENFDKVKTAVDKYMIEQEKLWKTYLPEQYDLIRKRKEEKYGDYLIYIVSTNNNLVSKTIKDMK
ncbi:MAG: DUF4358 domain-containing protein [Bacilli bacterium]